MSKRSRTAALSADDALAGVRAALAQGKVVDARALLAQLELRHLNAHIDGDAACLCARCIDAAPASIERGGVRFTLDVVAAARRALFYWVPDDLRAGAGNASEGSAGEGSAGKGGATDARAPHALDQLRARMRARLQKQLAPKPRRRTRRFGPRVRPLVVTTWLLSRDGGTA